MGFSLIVPPHKVKTGKLTVSCASWGAKGNFRLQIAMPHSLFSACFGTAEKVDVLWGNGSDEGKLLIAPPMVNDASSGLFKPTFLKNTVLLRLPESDITPEWKVPPNDPEHRQTKDGLVIMLPEWAWSKERQAAIRKAREHVAKERSAEARAKI